MSKKRRERGLFGQPISEAGDQEIVRIVKLALRLAKRHLADYSHAKSPQKFTQPQLFACLILKGHLGITYRKTEELLILMPAVREAIGLMSVPRFTTLQTFMDKPEVMAIIDGTGMETTSASAHFVSRAGRKRTKFVKLTMVVLCAAMLPISLVVDWGPSHDMRQAWGLREKLKATTRPTMLWGDGAFDSEPWHRANWDDWGVPSYAPTTVRSADGHVNGFYRNAFQIPVHEYGRRWSCETVTSGVKRVSGPTLRSRKQNTLFAEAAFNVAAYAIKVWVPRTPLRCSGQSTSGSRASMTGRSRSSSMRRAPSGSSSVGPP